MNRSLAHKFVELDKKLIETAVSLCEQPAVTYADYMRRVGEYIGIKLTLAELRQSSLHDEDGE